MAQHSTFVAGVATGKQIVINRTATLQSLSVLVGGNTEIAIWPGTGDIPSIATFYSVGGMIITCAAGVSILDIKRRFKDGITVQATDTSSKLLVVYT